jgi:hypothetical protein
MRSLLVSGESPYFRLETFLAGVAFTAVVLLVLKFLARGNRDNFEEIPEDAEDEVE